MIARMTVMPLALAFLAGCDWFEAQPEANLPPETEILHCGMVEEVVAGDDVTFTWTGTDIDGRVVKFEISYDGAPWEVTSLDSVLVSDVAQGEHEFRVRAVDDDGEVDPDPAVCSFTATVAGRLADRTVLIELFTTNTCPSCPDAEAIITALLDELGSDVITVVAYHDDPTDLPGSDPLATVQTDARIAWYTGNPGFPGDSDVWPTVVFDGRRVVEGVGTLEEAEALYRFEIDSRLATGSPLSMRVEGDIGATDGSVGVVVKAEDVPPSGTQVLRLALIEDDVKFRGIWTNRFHFVARLLLDDEVLGLSAVGDSVRVDRDFSVDQAWVIENLDVIAFVQDTGTMEVIQSARLSSD
jgi:hypothetical protein